jgi:hypothetical protein
MGPEAAGVPFEIFARLFLGKRRIEMTHAGNAIRPQLRDDKRHPPRHLRLDQVSNSAQIGGALPDSQGLERWATGEPAQGRAAGPDDIPSALSRRA